MMNVTITLTERDPLVRLDRVGYHLRSEKMLADMRKDIRWSLACQSGVHRVNGLKSSIVKCRSEKRASGSRRMKHEHTVLQKRSKKKLGNRREGDGG
jgi:hypothetical protein